MKIYTGYFAKLKYYTNNGLIPISIARKNPEWYIGHSCTYFAPSYDLLSRYRKNEISSEEYTKIYLNQLNKDTVKEKLDKIESKLGDVSVVLLCYEKPSDFCHRHVLAKYIKDNLNIDIIEYTQIEPG